MRKSILPFLFLLLSCSLPSISFAQITVTMGGTAAALAARLLGPGITVLSPTINCGANGSGSFVGTSVLSFDSGIVLTSGLASSVAGAASTTMSSSPCFTCTDASLASLTGGVTHDACVLEFNFRPAGDTVKFRYVFGSEEYPGFTCSGFNDVFGFFISGPGFSSPTNIALVPGTTIPVCINSINCAVSPGTACTSLGTGSPFCSYFVNNAGGTTIAFNGLTTTLTAIANVIPCDTYHLKLGVCDVSDGINDSGVFLEAGSLTSTGIHITPAGLNPGDTAIGSQYCVRGCSAGKIVFSRVVATPYPFTIHYTIGGTAVNGYDYATIADSAVIPGGALADTMYINPLLVTPAGPKTLKLYILSYFTCGGTPTVVDSAVMTIYDSLTAITGVASICQGATTTLVNSAAAGSWSSSNTAIATVGSSSGIVSGVAVGTATISYSLGTGCATARVVTINPIPGAIGGPTQVCPGSTITMTDAVSGGTWSSSNTARATITAGGIVTGVSVGTTNITYSIGGCFATKVVTVIALPSAISGVPTVCQFATTVLSDPGGGTWTSSNTGIATVGSAGTVTGVSAGTATITYSIGTGCNALMVVTVNPAPAVIGGTLRVCAGLTRLLTDATTGGTWLSSNPSIASIGLTSGLLTGGAVLFTTTATITYTAPGGCSISAIVTVNALPNPISGSPTACAGSSTTLTDPGGGTWSSSNTSIATVGSSSGTVWGVSLAGGTATITYTLPSGCDTTTTITIAPVPDPITGVPTMCEGTGTTTLFDLTPGGYWQSSNIDIASIDPFLGTVVAGTVPGIDTITYTASCAVSYIITVNPAPPPITGPGSVCTGSAITLLDAITGGTWTSSNTAAATVGLGTGIVTGGTVTSSAFVTITYTAPSTCATTTVITVYPAPNPISGVLHVCAGQSTTLSDPPGAGTWASSNTAVASVTPGPSGGGITTGGIPGTATIIYTQPGTSCTRSAIVTVNSAPGPILGSPNLCIGSCNTLTDATSSGTWTSSNTGVATIGATSGTVCGALAGTSTITYSLGGTCVVTLVVTVRASPPAIGGTPSACVGSSTTLTNSAGAGTWASSNTAVATIGVATSGTVYGASPGTSVITYTPTVGGCTRTIIVTINAAPTPFNVTGGGSYCSGGTGVHIGLDGSAPGVSYVVHSGSASFTPVIGTGGTLDLGLYTVAGTYTVTGALSCTSTMTGSAVITITPLPALFTVSGGGTMCPGSAGFHIILSGSVAGVSYQLYNGSTSIGSPLPGTGLSLDFGLQTAAGTYTVMAIGPSPLFCQRAMTGSATITISPSPVITGATALCVGATITESVPGFTGTWSSSNTAVITVVPTTGLVTGVANGTATLTFVASTGCTTSTVITVSFSPGPISGPGTVCVAGTATETDAISGGLWTSTPTSTATIGSLTGVVTGGVPGTVTITYSLGTGCTVTRTMTVTPSPAPITGSTGLCLGAGTTLGETTTGGTWTSSNSSVITSVSPTGVISGGGVGTSTLTYTVGGCSTNITVTVNPAPGAISGGSSVCAGNTLSLSDPTGGGTWTSSNTAVATVDGSGHVSGIIGGTSNITYSLGGTCVASKIITVNPISPISGSTGLCVGATTSLTDGTGGGTWSSSSTSVATVSSSGLVGGVFAGTATITYTAPGGCTATVVVTVNTAPGPITGNTHVCLGLCTLLSDAAGGGTWTSSNPSVATIGSGGLVCGVFAGTSTITYSLGFGCTRTVVVTVNPAPPAITGTMHVCAGASVTLSDAATGGTWESDNTAIATTTTTTGIVRGVNPGTATITYVPPIGCATVAIITVNPLPAPIVTTTSGTLCLGIITTISDATTGGTWSSSNTAVATVGVTSGDIGSIIAGTTTITYSVTGGCSTTTVVTVNTATAPISGGTSLCVGSITTLSDAAGSGVWSSDNTSIASVSASGVVYGSALGTATISYTVGGCPATTIVTVNSLPEPISGNLRVCVGATSALSDIPGGGSWSSVLSGVASINGVTGAVTGVAPGITTIVYSLGAGCTATAVVSVDPVPLPITGTTEVCLGYTTLLADATGSGIWSSSNTGIATITSTGVVSGVSGGPTTISYTNSLGCAATRLVTVVAVPPILGITNMCAYGVPLPLYDSAAGGAWTSTSGTISSAGVVTPFSAGVTTVTYTLPLGCYTISSVTVNPLPGPIVGLSHICFGSGMTLIDTASGGTWSSNNTSVIPVDASGHITGAAAGTATISYSMGSTCTATKTITVDTAPEAGIITGTPVVCVGSFTVLTDGAPGGLWIPGSVAASVFGGIVTGVSAGTDMISYSVTNSCGTAIATLLVTVNPLPHAGTITGASTVCTGAAITLTDAATGGVWSSSSTGVTVIAGVVSGVDVGVDTIKYTVTNSCGVDQAIKMVTVNALPHLSPITAVDTLCAGITFSLLDTATGGVWTVSNTHITINSFGVITAVSPGVDTITYSKTNGCGTATATAVVAVKAGPLAGIITGGSTLCSGAKDTLMATPSGGVWSSTNANATIATMPGGVVITGVSPGADTIIYTITNLCGPAVAIFPITILSADLCDSSTASGTASINKGDVLLTVWPNPNQGIFTVKLSSATDEPVQIVVTNIVGEKVKEINTTTNKATEIKLNDAAGVYFVTASTAHGNYVAKVMFAR